MFCREELSRLTLAQWNICRATLLVLFKVGHRHESVVAPSDAYTSISTKFIRKLYFSTPMRTNKTVIETAGKAIHYKDCCFR